LSQVQNRRDRRPDPSLLPVLPKVLDHHEVAILVVRLGYTIVVPSGSLWYCREATTSRPGEPALQSRAWLLVAKRGHDGKDAAQ